jgi:hypothetical protein
MNKMLTQTNQFNEPNSFSIQGKKTMIHTILKSHYAIKAFSAALALVGLLALAGQSQASVVITYANGGAAVYEPYVNVVSATDAANQGISSFGTLTQTAGSAIYGSSLSSLNDGIVYNPGTMNDRGNTLWSFTPSNGSVIEFTFNSAQKIGSINTFAMSGGGQLRSAQNYGLEYQSAGNWTSLLSSLDTSAPGNLNFGNTSTWVNLDFSGFAGGSLADVTALRFTFQNVGGNNEPLYREIDVNTIPEPSTLTLLGMALGGIILFRRRCCS